MFFGKPDQERSQKKSLMGESRVAAVTPRPLKTGGRARKGWGEKQVGPEPC